MQITCGGKQVQLIPLGIPIKAPATCITCGSALVKDGAHIFCRNEECEGRAIRRIKTWITKRNIKFLGDELLIELFERQGIKEPQDIYTLTEEKLAKMPRGNGVVGSASKQIMAEIEKSKKCPLNEFVGALCIPFLGRRQAEILIKGGINTLEKFILIKEIDLEGIPGFKVDGSKTLGIVDGLKKARGTMKALLDAGIVVEEPSAETAAPVEGGKLSGYAVCFTGVRPTGDEESKFISLGGVVKDGVSKNTTHLVVKDTSKSSNKTKKAQELGTKIVSYDEFKSWL